MIRLEQIWQQKEEENNKMETEDNEFSEQDL